MRTAEEPLLQWRRDGTDNAPQIISIYEGIVTPIAFQRGQETATGNLTFLTNPAFILINPSADMDDEPLDIVQGDLLVRLKYLESPYKTKEDGTKACRDYTIPYAELDTERQAELQDIGFNAVHHIFTVHSFETQFDGIRILGDLQA